MMVLLTGLATAVRTPAIADTSPTAHREAECATCHQGGASIQHRTESVAKLCADCHAPSAFATAKASFHGRSSGRCLACHSFHEPSLVTLAVGAGNQLPTAGVAANHCQSCHDPRGDLASLSPAHRTAADLYHAAAGKLQDTNPSQACLNCHSNRSNSAWQGKAAGAVLAFNEHASHPYGVQVVPGAGNSSNWIAWEIDERLPLFDGRMECQTCHLLTAGNDDLMIPFETKYDLCKGCHRQYGDEEAATIVADLGR